MEFWNNIIHTAMMGTDKKSIGAEELPADFSEEIALVNERLSSDKEERFLQLASLAYNYRQCGVAPLKKETAILPLCPPEEKPYCTREAMQALRDILDEPNIPLLKIWLRLCADRQQLARPEAITTLLSIGLQQKTLQSLIAKCCGRRGEWLGRFNEVWKFSTTQTPEESWQTGTAEQRKAALQELRSTNPALARQWLQQTWEQEDANTKASFLSYLSVNIGAEDLPFLESLSAEKSKKVRDEATQLLRMIPGSSVVNLYTEALQKSVHLKKEKGLLGLSAKTALHFELPSGIEETLNKTGIEKLSNRKEFTDDEFIIYQLIQFTPVSFWEQHFNESFENVIKHFQKDAIGKKMVPALVLSIKNFNDHSGAIRLMQHSDVFYIDIIPLLPLQQQDHYSIQHFEKYPEQILQYAAESEIEWSMELAEKIFKHTSKNPYHYTRNFYNQVIDHLPVKAIAALEKAAPEEENLKNMWKATSDYITKLITIKANTLKAFNF